jgi:3-methyladenine DNA glycosylase AlkD
MTLDEMIDVFEANRNTKNIEGMKRYGIVADNAYGIKTDYLRAIAKRIKKNHNLAVELWETKIHEARKLAPMIAVPSEVSTELADKWTFDFNSWDICDSCCGELFRYSETSINRINYWAEQKEEYVRRTAFALIATLAVKRKDAKYDEFFYNYFPLIKKYCTDDRNFVYKAIDWSIRQIGKRNQQSITKAIELCNEILVENPDSKTAKWIAKTALKELNSKRNDS